MNIPGARRAVVCAPPLAYSGARVGEQLAESCWNCDLGGVSCDPTVGGGCTVGPGVCSAIGRSRSSISSREGRFTIDTEPDVRNEGTNEGTSGTLCVLPSPESRRASPAFGYDATRIAGSSGRRDTLEARMSCPGTSVLYPRVVCVLYAHCAFPVESVNGTLTGWHRRTWSGTPFRGRGSRDK